MNGGGKLALQCGGPSGYFHSSLSLQLAYLDPDCRNPSSHSKLHLVKILFVPMEQYLGDT